VTPRTLREVADDWMEANPEAMQHFRRFAEQMRERGCRFGIGLLAERVRWEMHLRGVVEGDFKINNNFRAYIARRLCLEDPRLAELIRCRVTHAADHPYRPPHAAQEADPL
jgi:hypothetical protein